MAECSRGLPVRPVQAVIEGYGSGGNALRGVADLVRPDLCHQPEQFNLFRINYLVRQCSHAAHPKASAIERERRVSHTKEMLTTGSNYRAAMIPCPIRQTREELKRELRISLLPICPFTSGLAGVALWLASWDVVELTGTDRLAADEERLLRVTGRQIRTEVLDVVVDAAENW